MKPTFPFERHEHVGRALWHVRNYLLFLHNEVANSRGSNRQKKAVAALRKAYDKVDEARHNLEEVMFMDHDRGDIGVYYCGGKEKEKRQEEFEQALKKT